MLSPDIPENLKYAKTHEWVDAKDGKAKIGISDHAQHEISDVVHVELPEAGREVQKGDPVAVVESVKAAFDIYAPVGGKITAVNEEVANAPELINQEPYGKGWFFEVEVSEENSELMDSKIYKEFLTKETAK